MMRAWRVTEHGTPPQPLDVPEPEAGPDERLVRLTAVPVTPLDVLTASGTSYFGPPALPYTPGVQGVGVLFDEPEHRVWFTTDAGMQPGDGSLAELAAVPEARMWTITEDVPDTVVAGLGLSAVAAHGALRRGRFDPSDRVLVLGAGGVVGRVGVQLARCWGARQVAAACRGPQAGRQAAEAGAEVVVDTAGADAAELAERFTRALPDGVDLIIDPVWGSPAQAAAHVLAPYGRLVNLGGSAGPTAHFDSALVRSRSLEILGYTNLAQSWPAQTAAMGEILALVAAGGLVFSPEVVAASEADEGWRRQAAGTARSRVVVDFAPHTGRAAVPPTRPT